MATALTAVSLSASYKVRFHVLFITSTNRYLSVAFRTQGRAHTPSTVVYHTAGEQNPRRRAFVHLLGQEKSPCIGQTLSQQWRWPTSRRRSRPSMSILKRLRPSSSSSVRCGRTFRRAEPCPSRDAVHAIIHSTRIRPSNLLCPQDARGATPARGTHARHRCGSFCELHPRAPCAGSDDHDCGAAQTEL